VDPCRIHGFSGRSPACQTLARIDQHAGFCRDDGALERRIEVSVPRERIEQAIDERLKRVSRTAKLKGFRPARCR